MPVALIVALAASLGMHALALFGPELALPMENEAAPLIAELKPATPRALATGEALPTVREAAAAAVRSQHRPQRAHARPSPAVASGSSIVAASTVASGDAAADSSLASGSLGGGDGAAQGEPAKRADDALPTSAPQSLLDEPAPASLPLPAKGTIRYWVERGDPGLRIGEAVHQWEIAGGAYRITAVTETVGLVAFFRPLRVLAESRGRVIGRGLVPQSFVSRRDGREAGEQAAFDWREMELRMPGRPAHALLPGTQDLLSFHYQLALAGDLAGGSRWPIATGRKYVTYTLEVLGDEDLHTPMGVLRCRHVRVPGTTTTDVWLSHEHALLPVRIVHRDRKGDVFAQVATSIETAEVP